MAVYRSADHLSTYPRTVYIKVCPSSTWRCLRLILGPPACKAANALPPNYSAVYFCARSVGTRNETHKVYPWLMDYGNSLSRGIILSECKKINPMITCHPAVF